VELVTYCLIGLVGILIITMIVRIKALYTSFDSQDLCLSHALRFTHQQIIKFSPAPTQVSESACLYLIGAIEFLGKQHGYDRKERLVLTVKVLKSFFEISARDLNSFYTIATSKSSTTPQHNMVRSGAKAIKLWLKAQNTPTEFDLHRQLSDWNIAKS